MRIGLISDTEGNARALAAALAGIRSHAPDVIVYAGDILDCPFSPEPPAETISQLRADDIRAIPGNRDRYLIDWATPRWNNTLWMRLRRSDPPGPWLEQMAAGQAALSADELSWLRSLPEEFVLTDGVYVCHGMPGNPWNSFWPAHPTYDGNLTAAERDASLRLLARADASVVLCGHAPEPAEYHDELPDGRPLHIVRAGPRSDTEVDYAILTHRQHWEVTWHTARIRA